MSVMVETEDGQILLFSKGADRFAFSLLRQGMKQIHISVESPEIKALEKEGNKDEIVKASRKRVLDQIKKGKSELYSSGQESSSRRSRQLIL